MTGLPESASSHAPLIDGTLASGALHGGLLFLAGAAILAAALLRRTRPSAPAPRRAAALVVAAGVAASVSLELPLLLRTARDLREVFWNFRVPESDPRTLRVQVHARQWTWEMRLAGGDGAFATADDVVVFDELRVPLGAPVHLQLAAADVVHSFSVPAMRLKLDAIPGRITEAWFEASREGSFAIACQQYCGPGHSRMHGRLIVLDEASFRCWLRRAEQLSAIRTEAATSGASGESGASGSSDEAGASRASEDIETSGWPWRP